jgi:hypothetical protein
MRCGWVGLEVVNPASPQTVEGVALGDVRTEAEEDAEVVAGEVTDIGRNLLGLRRQQQQQGL